MQTSPRSSSLSVSTSLLSGINNDLGGCPNTSSYGVCLVASCTWVLRVSTQITNNKIYKFESKFHFHMSYM